MASNFFICPTCGDEVEVGSDGCPTCLAGEDLDFHGDGLGLDLPEDDLFDYDRFVAEEFGGVPKKSGKEWFWWIIAVIVLIVFGTLTMRGWF